MCKRFSIGALLLCAVSTAAHAQLFAAGVFVAPAMTKLKADHPEQVKADTTITIRAARNEFESFQLALVGPLSNITPTSGGFQKDQGSASALPSMRFFREDLVTVAQKSANDTTMDVDASGNSVATRFPDALVPAVDEVIGASRNAFGSNFSVASGEVRAVWVDVFVPPDTSPGMYTGTVNLTWTEGTHGASINFKLEVWNFTLPSTPSLKTTTGIHFWGLPHGHPNVNINGLPDPARLARLRARYGQLALDHRLSLGYNIDDGASVDDLAHFDTYYKPSFDGTIGLAPAYDPASIGTQLQGARLTALRVAGTPSTWSSHFSSGLDRLYFYTCNEPPKYIDTNHPALSAPDVCGPKLGVSGAGWSGIPQLASTAQSPNHIRSLVTTNITYANANSVTSGIDIFSALINHMDVKSIDSDAIGAGLAAGEHQGNYTTWLGQSSVTGYPHELWTYQSCMSHACNAKGFYHPLLTGWPSYVIDADPIRARAQEWLSFRYGAVGELYYEAVQNYSNGVNANDPWATPWNPEFGGNGEGTLFYPGRPNLIGGTSSVSGDIADIPIASLRLKMIREGVEDYEYMKMASTLAGDSGSWVKALVPNVFPHAYDTNEPAASGDADRRAKSERLMDYRGQIAQRIRELTPNGLVLTDVRHPSVQSSSAVITWTSDLNGTSQVKYGTTPGTYPNSSTLDASLVTSHTVSLTGLSSQQTYYYVVMTKSAQNVLTSSPEDHFATTSSTLSAPSLDANPSPTNLTATGATVAWNTTPEGDSTVEYGTSTGVYSSSKSNADQVLIHTVSLSELTPATRYYYRVKSKNAGGSMTSGEFNFMTNTPTAPNITDIRIPSITETTASLAWKTDVVSTTQAKYGTTSGSYPNVTTLDPASVQDHGVSLSGLNPKTKYYFVVVSGNAGGTSTSFEQNFTTHDSPDTNPVWNSMVGNLTDSFTSFDPSKWTATTVAVDDTADDYAGVLRLSPTASVGNARVYIDSLKTWSLIGSSATVNVLQVVAADGGVNCKFTFHAPGTQAFNQLVGFWYEWGNLNAYYYVDGQQFGVATVPYSPLNHAWWRISEAGGTILWETSGDRVTWTPIGQVAKTVLNFDLTQGVVGFDVATYGTGNPTPGIAQFANLNVAPPALSTFHDPFPILNTDIWYVEQDTAGSTVSASSGVLSLSPEPGNASGGAAVIGYATYALTGSSFSVKVPQTVSSGPNVNQVLRLAPGPFEFERSLGFWYEGGLLHAYTEEGGNATAVASLTYSPTTHAYWRVRESAGTIFWDTSADGAIWTNRAQTAVTNLSFSPSSVSVYFTSREFSSGSAAPGVGKFANVNQ